VVIHRVFNHIAPASLRRLRAFFGDTLAGIQRRITGPSPTGRSPATCHPCHTGTLVDKATRFTLGKALPRKSDGAHFVHDGLKRLQLIPGRTVGRYHSDGARELMMPTLVTFLRAQGTEMTTKAAHSPSSNSDPEVKNRAIFNGVRKALTTIGIEHRYWTYTAADAVNKLNFIPQRQPDGLYRPPIIALGAPDLPTTPTHLLPFGRRSYLTDTLATKRELAPRPLPARYLTVPSQHQFQVLLPNDTVRLVRASEFIPIIGDGSAPATVPPANIQKSHTSSIKDLHNPGVLATAALTFSRNHRGTRLRHMIQQLSQQRKRLILAPAPPRNEHPLTALASVSSPSCRPEAPATNAAALLLVLAAALPPKTADLLYAPRSIKEARCRPDADEWRRVHDAELPPRYGAPNMDLQRPPAHRQAATIYNWIQGEDQHTRGTRAPYGSLRNSWRPHAARR
jgi:hypothetical protein